MSAPSSLPRRRLIVAFAPENAFAPMARSMLARLGYAIVPVEELPLLPGDPSQHRPQLRLVDEGRLARVPPDDPGEPPVPIVLLTRRSPADTRDPRIIGAVRKPAGMHELYRVIQQIFEEKPRSTPRVDTELAARCRMGEREWPVALLCLSENGCLLRSREPLPLGSRVELVFELPQGERVETEAEASYLLISDLGMVFHATPAAKRHAIQTFVARQLLDA